MLLRELLRNFITIFKPYEKAVFDALIGKLDYSAGKRLSRQINQINKVQRHSNQKEVNLYHMENGKPYFDNSLKFPLDNEEVKLAEISFEVDTIVSIFHASIWLVNGFIFSIEFNKSPKEIKKNKLKINKVSVLANPMVKANDQVKSRGSLDTIASVWLKEWIERWELIDIYKPIAKQKRSAYFSKLNAKLPDDYIDIVSQADGIETKKFMIHGLSEVKSLVLNDANYYILATLFSKGVFVIKQDSKDALVYYIDYEKEGKIQFDASLIKAVEAIISLGNSGDGNSGTSGAGSGSPENSGKFGAKFGGHRT